MVFILYLYYIYIYLCYIYFYCYLYILYNDLFGKAAASAERFPQSHFFIDCKFSKLSFCYVLV